MKLSLLIPLGQRDAAILPTLLKRLAAVDLGDVEKEVLVLHRTSTDHSVELLRTLPPEIRVIQDVALERGELIARAVSEASGNYLLVQEPDLRFEPEDYKVLLRTLRKGNLSAVFGLRPLRALPLFERAGVLLLGWFAQLCFHLPRTDPQGMILLDRALAQAVPWGRRGEDGWAVVILGLARTQVAVGTVPLRFYSAGLFHAAPSRRSFLRGNLATLSKYFFERLSWQLRDLKKQLHS